MDNVLYGKEIRATKEEKLKAEVARLREHGKIPSLVSIQVGQDDNSAVYLNAQRKIALNLGIDYITKHFENTLTPEILAYNLDKLNKDDTVDAVIVQTPLPKQIDYNEVIVYLSPDKDAEGTHPQNMGRMCVGKDELAPPTAKAVIEILDYANVDFVGKNVVVVGHSPIVGKPLALLFLNRNATVSVTHKATSDKGFLNHYLKHADIVVVAVGRKGLIKGDMLKDGAIVVDVGINFVDGKIWGDVDFESVKAKASLITPVPGGVGTVTSVALMENVVYLAKKRMS